jgi:hypothetical protein
MEVRIWVVGVITNFIHVTMQYTGKTSNQKKYVYYTYIRPRGFIFLEASQRHQNSRFHYILPDNFSRSINVYTTSHGLASCSVSLNMFAATIHVRMLSTLATLNIAFAFTQHLLNTIQ